MQALKIAVEILLTITSLVLVLLILLDKGQGGGISDMFGGGISTGAGSSGVAQKNLDRFTVIVASVWILCIIGLLLLFKYYGV
jgi:preprotein translocase subunit SecG